VTRFPTAATATVRRPPGRNKKERPKAPRETWRGRPWSSGVEIGEYRGVVRVPRRVFQRLLPERPTPERCVEAPYVQRTRFESIPERKLRPAAVTENGNVEISGRDLRLVQGGDRADTRRSVSNR
jgi:hypothetical protein